MAHQEIISVHPTRRQIFWWQTILYFLEHLRMSQIDFGNFFVVFSKYMMYKEHLTQTTDCQIHIFIEELAS